MLSSEFSIPYSASDFTEQTDKTEGGIKHGVLVLLGIRPLSLTLWKALVSQFILNFTIFKKSKYKVL